MRNKKLPSIRKIFFKIISIFAIIQIIAIILFIIIVNQFYKTEKNHKLQNDLLILDSYTAGEIAKYVILKNEYALSLQLYYLQDKNKTNYIKFYNKTDDMKLEKCTALNNLPNICNLGNGTFVGVTPIFFNNKIIGSLITKKNYFNEMFYSKLSGLVLILFLIVILILLLNYWIILSSIKKFVNQNLTNLIKIISGSTITECFNTKDFKIVANYIIHERSKIKTLQKTLSEQQLNEAIYRISANVAHDLNNPINGVRMIMPKIKNNMIETPELKLLETYINQIYSIASDVLNYFQENTSNDNLANNISLPRFVLLEEMISNIIQNNKNWQNSIEFVNNHYSWIYLTPIQLYRKITNLLTNAHESLTNPVKKIIIKTSTSGNMIILTIEDTGCGIPQEYLLEVLHGKSLKPNGHGFGLSSAVEYFEDIGGNLFIESTPNIGTKITIQIPQAIPNWFSSTIKYTDNTIFAIFENDINVLSYWQQLFIDIDNKKQYFTNIESCITWIKSSNLIHSVLIISYEWYKVLESNNLPHTNDLSMIYITYNNTQEYEAQNIRKDTRHKLISNFLLQKMVLDYVQN